MSMERDQKKTVNKAGLPEIKRKSFSFTYRWDFLYQPIKLMVRKMLFIRLCH